MKFLVLKKIAGDEDAKILSPTDVIDMVWHKLLLNPRLYKNINEALGGEMIDHNPEGGRDVAARNKRVHRTIEMYKTVFITSATSISSSVWKAPEELPIADDVITIRVRDMTGGETLFKCRKTMRVRNIFSAFAAKKGVDVSDLRFLNCELERFLGHEIIGDILEDGDQINVMPGQVGC
jgi:hypothetical protein